MINNNDSNNDTNTVKPILRNSSGTCCRNLSKWSYEPKSMRKGYQ